MIVYTVRGGVAAVIWTDVVQMFIYVGGALLVFFGLLQLIPGGWNEVARVGGGHFQVFDFSTDPTRLYTFWAGLLGGDRADAGDPRHRPVPGPAAALGAIREASLGRA